MMILLFVWIPASAGMTKNAEFLIPNPQFPPQADFIPNSQFLIPAAGGFHSQFPPQADFIPNS